MNQIIKNLEKQLELMNDFVQLREDKIDTMSEKWQESEKCEEFQDLTQEYEEQANELYIIIDNLKGIG